MPQPTISDVHVNVPLTNISVAYIQDAKNFIADTIFPNVPVTKQSDRYYTYDRGMFNRDEMMIRAPGGESAGGGYTVDNTPTYYAPVYAFHHDIPDQIRANTDAMVDPDRDATIFLTQKALIKREKTWVTNFFTTGKWTLTDITGVSASPGSNQALQWNDPSSTPIEDIRGQKTAILQSTGFEPNTLVIGQQVYDKLIDHPDIIDRVKYGQTAGAPAQIDTSDLQNLLKIQRVLVMKAVENTAKEGQTNSHAFIGGKSALLCYSAPQAGLMIPSAGYTFSWTGFLGAASAGQRIKRFRMEHLESDRVEIQMAYTQKQIGADLGQFWTSIVA
jgi:hypothetical protein